MSNSALPSLSFPVSLGLEVAAIRRAVTGARRIARRRRHWPFPLGSGRCVEALEVMRRLLAPAITLPRKLLAVVARRGLELLLGERGRELARDLPILGQGIWHGLVFA